MGFLSRLQKETYELIPDDTHRSEDPTERMPFIGAPSSSNLSSSDAGAPEFARSLVSRGSLVSKSDGRMDLHPKFAQF